MASTSTDTSVTTNSSKFLEGFCSTEDFFHHFVPYLTYQDVGRLESVSKRLQTLAQESMWKVVCRRDFNFQEDDHDMIGPTYHQERRSFDRLEKASNWNIVIINGGSGPNGRAEKPNLITFARPLHCGHDAGRC